MVHDVFALGRLFGEAKQASDEAYVHNAALCKLIERLCAKRWNANISQQAQMQRRVACNNVKIENN